MDGAKTIGVLFTADSIDSYNTIVSFANSLSQKDKKVLCIGYVENKKQYEMFAEQSGFRFFSDKHCNWYGKPKSQSVDYFIGKDFDILMDVSLRDKSTIDYIVGLSKAKYKVGSIKQNDKLYDLMIDISKQNTLENLLQQIEIYLNMFKVKQNTES